MDNTTPTKAALQEQPLLIYAPPTPPEIEFTPLHPFPEDVLLSGSSDYDSEDTRLEKKERREQRGQDYLLEKAGPLISASLRGPLHENWRNPWAKDDRKLRAKSKSRTGSPLVHDGRGGSVIKRSLTKSEQHTLWSKKNSEAIQLDSDSEFDTSRSPSRRPRMDAQGKKADKSYMGAPQITHPFGHDRRAGGYSKKTSLRQSSEDRQLSIEARSRRNSDIRFTPKTDIEAQIDALRTEMVTTANLAEMAAIHARMAPLLAQLSFMTNSAASLGRGRPLVSSTSKRHRASHEDTEIQVINSDSTSKKQKLSAGRTEYATSPAIRPPNQKSISVPAKQTAKKQVAQPISNTVTRPRTSQKSLQAAVPSTDTAKVLKRKVRNESQKGIQKEKNSVEEREQSAPERYPIKTNKDSFAEVRPFITGPTATSSDDRGYNVKTRLEESSPVVITSCRPSPSDYFSSNSASSDPTNQDRIIAAKAIPKVATISSLQKSSSSEFETGSVLPGIEGQLGKARLIQDDMNLSISKDSLRERKTKDQELLFTPQGRGGSKATILSRSVAPISSVTRTRMTQRKKDDIAIAPSASAGILLSHTTSDENPRASQEHYEKFFDRFSQAKAFAAELHASTASAIPEARQLPSTTPSNVKKLLSSAQRLPASTHVPDFEFKRNKDPSRAQHMLNSTNRSGKYGEIAASSVQTSQIRGMAKNRVSFSSTACKSCAREYGLTCRCGIEVRVPQPSAAMRNSTKSSTELQRTESVNERGSKSPSGTPTRQKEDGSGSLNRTVQGHGYNEGAKENSTFGAEAQICSTDVPTAQSVNLETDNQFVKSASTIVEPELSTQAEAIKAQHSFQENLSVLAYNSQPGQVRHLTEASSESLRTPSQAAPSRNNRDLSTQAMVNNISPLAASAAKQEGGLLKSVTRSLGAFFGPIFGDSQETCRSSETPTRLKVHDLPSDEISLSFKLPASESNMEHAEYVLSRPQEFYTPSKSTSISGSDYEELGAPNDRPLDSVDEKHSRPSSRGSFTTPSNLKSQTQPSIPRPVASLTDHQSHPQSSPPRCSPQRSAPQNPITTGRLPRHLSSQERSQQINAAPPPPSLKRLMSSVASTGSALQDAQRQSYNFRHDSTEIERSMRDAEDFLGEEYTEREVEALVATELQNRSGSGGPEAGVKSGSRSTSVMQRAR